MKTFRANVWFITSLLCWHLALGQLDVSHNKEWNVWKAKYHKKYSSSSQELAKRAVWEKNSALVKEHNSRSGTTFKLAMNQFGDLEQMNHSRQHISSPQTYPAKKAKPSSNWSTIPNFVDWRKKGVVTSVHNQGVLDQSAAFAAADAVASFHAIHTGHLEDLSAKEVADCCTPQLPRGAESFDCIHKLGGLCTSTAYEDNNGTCNNQSCTPYAKVPTGGQSVARGSEKALAVAVVIEPVMVAIDASQPTFQLYSSGVYTNPNCSSNNLDHAMLVVGYGTAKDGMDYWICKNSWGKSWGMEGYILMARNRNNMCGIATDAAYPV